jgi:predicted HicB family RNase H-like nuclease
MKYKGYRGQVNYDEEAKLFHGEVVGLRDVITFQGTSVDELEQAFKDSIDEYFDFCNELGRTPEKPFSGRLILRLPPEIHQKAAHEAACNGLSLNAWINQGIQQLISASDWPLSKNIKTKSSSRKRCSKVVH